MKNIVAGFFYYLFKFLRKSKASASSIAPAVGVSQDNYDEHYFQYEIKKSPAFDQRFNLNLKDKVVVEIGSGYGGYIFHALQQQAKFMFGVDVEEHRVNKSIELMKKHYSGNNYDISCRGGEDMKHIEDASVDMVVTDACIEHIYDRMPMFQEIYRILKPGGDAYLSTSPIWLTWNGGHLFRYIPLPWSHIFLPDSVIIAILEMQKRKGDFPAYAIDNMIVIYKTIGKLTIGKLKKEIARSGFKQISFTNFSRNKIKRTINKFPVLEEFFAGNIRFHLTKPLSKG